jgi:hypothetical protein
MTKEERWKTAYETKTLALQYANKTATFLIWV